MNLKKSVTGVCLTLGLIAAFGGAAFAQQPQTNAPGTTTTSQPQQERMGRRGGRRGDHPMMGMMRILGELNLTDAQKAQVHAIAERYNTSTQPQRDQLRQLREQYELGTASSDAEQKAQALRDQLRESHKQMHAEIINVLTPEQRTKFEEVQQQLKSRRRGMRDRQPDTQDDNQ